MTTEHKANLHREAQTIEREMNLADGQTCYRIWCDNNSPYSWKLRAYLHYKGIPYQRMRNNAHAYMQRIPSQVGMSIIPVMLTADDQVLQDTTPIMQLFEERYPSRACIPDDPRLAFLMWLIEDFADEYLVRLSMHYRWGNLQNRSALSHRLARALCYGLPQMRPGQMAPMVLQRQSGFDQALGLDGEGVRASLDQQLIDLLAILDGHFEHYQFLLGDRPSLADFAVFGQLFAHLYQDPFSAELMELHGPRTCNWIETLHELGDVRGGVGQTSFGEWLDIRGGVPAGLASLLAFVGMTYIPFSAGTALASGERKKTFRAEVYGVDTTFLTSQYRAWSFEQVQQRYLALDELDWRCLEPLLKAARVLPAMLANGVIHNSLYDGFSPPFIRDGIADARIQHLKAKAARSSA